MQTGKYAVIGIGDFGRAIAISLAQKGVEVLAIDCIPEAIESISSEVAYAVTMDATDEKALIALGIAEYDAVVVAIGQHFEQRIFCSSLLVQLNVKRLIVRAVGDLQIKILEKIGIKEILSPEDEVGKIVAEKLLKPSMISYLQLPDDHRIEEIIVPHKIANRTVGDINIRDRYKLSLITIKRTFNEHEESEFPVQHILGVPDTKTEILTGDHLVVFGRNKDIDRFIEINK
jgi:trk system potassium uptake protein